MIRHLFKIIWNERRSNGWIVLEYTVVFCILWFCCDYLCFLQRGAMDPMGFDMENTYQIQMGLRETALADGDTSQREEMSRYEIVKTFSTRVKQYPGVEEVAFGQSAMPYGMSLSSSSYLHLPDSNYIDMQIRRVSSEFFAVYKMPLTSGRLFASEDEAERNKIIITPGRNGLIRDEEGVEHKVTDIHAFGTNNEEVYEVIGTMPPVKGLSFEGYRNSLFLPLHSDQIDRLQYLQIVMRVSPHVGKDFPERFVRDMREQLNIGPYFLVNINSARQWKEKALQTYEITDKQNSVYAITAFLVVNIFLGVIGTFWYRAQARRSEIGLRISMGASRRKVRAMIYTETLLLLFVASIVAVNICVNIAQTDLLEAIDMPRANREYVGMGIEQDFLNYGLTFLFLGAISLLAVWYPTRQASRVAPAEALREE